MTERDRNLTNELLLLVESSETDIAQERHVAEVQGRPVNRGLVDYERGRIDAYRYVVEALQSDAYGSRTATVRHVSKTDPHVVITDPTLDETGRCAVDPTTYYDTTDRP